MEEVNLTDDGYECPECREHLMGGENFCEFCGTELDWSNTNW